jgi:DHA1 family purine ribonucleoside efflux pump-like MFS transporter
LGFAAVTGGYLAVTTAEWVVPPLFPVLAPVLGLGTGTAGLVFAVLGVAIATGGLVGGFALVRVGPRVGIVVGLTLVAAGAVVCATADGLEGLLVGEIVLGLGSGTFFAPGVHSAGALAGERRRGIAIGIYGVAFSAGVALAGLLAALGDTWGWRVSFLATAGIAFAAALALVPFRLAAVRRQEGARPPFRLRAAVAPLAVGGVTAASQYGTVAFLPLYAVHAWGLSPGKAALVITVSRVLSVPAKLLTGNAADREGSLRIARRLGVVLALLGAWWTLAPGPEAAVGGAILFGAVVAALGPVGNVLALDAFAGRGQLLGAFRSAQIGLGAATSAILGAGAAVVGLRPMLVVTSIAIPASLLALRLGSAGAAPEAERGEQGVDAVVEGALEP